MLMDDYDFDPDAEEFLAATPDDASDRDVASAADQLVKKYGRDAPTIAAMRAADWLDCGDVNQYRLVKRIQMAVDELLMMVPSGGR